MVKLTDAQLAALIHNVQSWAPDADPDLVDACVRRAWGIMEADPCGIAPIAFVGALLRLAFMADSLDAVLRITEHLVDSMADWDVVEDPGQYDA